MIYSLTSYILMNNLIISLKTLPQGILSAFTLLWTIALTGCSDNDKKDEPIWDFAPVSIGFKITDTDGNNLLHPDTDGNWVNSDFTIVYDGMSYPTVWDYDMGNPHIYGYDYPKSKAYLPAFRGLIYTQASHFWIDGQWVQTTEMPILSFGEFASTRSYELSMELQTPCRSNPYHIDVLHKCFNADTPSGLDFATSIKIDGVDQNFIVASGGIHIITLTCPPQEISVTE